MRHVIVRYTLRPDRVAEHEALIRGVLDELRRTAPAGLSYGAFKQPDGVSYVHVASVASEPNPLTALTAFEAFTARIAERCVDPPVSLELTAIGTYAFDPRPGPGVAAPVS